MVWSFFTDHECSPQPSGCRLNRILSTSCCLLPSTSSGATGAVIAVMHYFPVKFFFLVVLWYHFPSCLSLCNTGCFIPIKVISIVDKLWHQKERTFERSFKTLFTVFLTDQEIVSIPWSFYDKDSSAFVNQISSFNSIDSCGFKTHFVITIFNMKGTLTFDS